MAGNSAPGPSALPSRNGCYWVFTWLLRVESGSQLRATTGQSCEPAVSSIADVQLPGDSALRPERLPSKDKRTLPNPELPAVHIGALRRHLLNRQHDLAAGVALLQVAQRLPRFTELVSPIDDRGHLPGLHESAESG